MPYFESSFRISSALPNPEIGTGASCRKPSHEVFREISEIYQADYEQPGKGVIQVWSKLDSARRLLLRDPGETSGFCFVVGVERGDLIFARHGTVLASKAKREAPTEAVGCMLSVGRKGKIGIVDHGSGSCAVLARVGDLAASRGRYSPSF